MGKRGGKEVTFGYYQHPHCFISILQKEEEAMSHILFSLSSSVRESIFLKNVCRKYNLKKHALSQLYNRTLKAEN